MQITKFINALVIGSALISLAGCSNLSTNEAQNNIPNEVKSNGKSIEFHKVVEPPSAPPSASLKPDNTKEKAQSGVEYLYVWYKKSKKSAWTDKSTPNWPKPIYTGTSHYSVKFSTNVTPGIVVVQAFDNVGQDRVPNSKPILFCDAVHGSKSSNNCSIEKNVFHFSLPIKDFNKAAYITVQGTWERPLKDIKGPKNFNTINGDMVTWLFHLQK